MSSSSKFVSDTLKLRTMTLTYINRSLANKTDKLNRLVETHVH